jgi:hypothetical protein
VAVPLTFPSHAAAIAPLKLWRPLWFDGVALVVGSAAPDFAYALQPYVTIRAHRWWALIWFCVPATMVITRVVRAVAAEVAAHLTGVWRDYRVLATSRHRWFVTGSPCDLADRMHQHRQAGHAPFELLELADVDQHRRESKVDQPGRGQRGVR